MCISCAYAYKSSHLAEIFPADHKHITKQNWDLDSTYKPSIKDKISKNKSKFHTIRKP
jgi:hypothetical protein